MMIHLREKNLGFPYMFSEGQRKEGQGLLAEGWKGGIWMGLLIIRQVILHLFVQLPVLIFIITAGLFSACCDWIH